MTNRLGVPEFLLEAFGSWEARLRGHAAVPTRQSDAADVFCFGQSHTISLRRAWRRGLYRPVDSRLHFTFLLSDNKRFPDDGIIVQSPVTGEDMINPELERAFTEHAVLSGSTETWFVSTLRGNAYNVYGLFEPDPLFDFVHPELPTLGVRADAQILPYEAVRAILARATDITRRFYKCLPRENVAGILHIEAPPPIPDEEQCRRAFDQRLMRSALKIPKEVRISPPEFRLKLWQTQSDVHREVCREQGVIYVTPPEEAVDESGYLVPAGWHGATHASAWYGALMLKKIEGIIMERRREAAPRP